MPPRLKDGGFQKVYVRNEHENLQITMLNSRDYLTIQIRVSHYIEKNLY